MIRLPRAEVAGALPRPCLLFLGDITEPGYAKTALGLRDWAGDACIGEWRLPGCTVSTGLPQCDAHAGVAAGARALVIGVAVPAGRIPEAWLPSLVAALAAGLDLVSGMHTRLADVPALRDAAAQHGRRLHDVRVPPSDLPVATGRKRRGRRLLTVGTDCALGKKYTALALVDGLQGRGLDVQLRATGQTGILIAGQGIAIDAVVSDFAAGAAEVLSPDAPDDHWDVIEGQGSLFHPAYAGVALSLLHGSQPDAFVVCHAYGRTQMLGYPLFTVPTIEAVIEATLLLGCRTSPSIRCAGVSLNTRALDDTAAVDACDTLSRRLGLPVADPMRRASTGFGRLVDSCLS